jgi:hypothetical protein
MTALLRSSLGLFLAVLLCVPATAFGQQQSAFGQQPPASAPENGPSLPVLPLRLIVLEGSDGQNSIPLNRSVTPVVEVRDDKDRVVEGATVEFKLPASGPGGTFPGNRTFFSMRTNGQGQAAAPFIVNNIPGRFEIQISATFGNREGRTVIRQVNASQTYFGPPPPKTPFLKRKSTWMLIGVAAAGAAVAVYFATREDSASTNVVIRPGGPVVGGPR